MAQKSLHVRCPDLECICLPFPSFDGLGLVDLYSSCLTCCLFTVEDSQTKTRGLGRQVQGCLHTIERNEAMMRNVLETTFVIFPICALQCNRTSWRNSWICERSNQLHSEGLTASKRNTKTGRQGTVASLQILQDFIQRTNMYFSFGFETCKIGFSIFLGVQTLSAPMLTRL